MMGSRAVSRRDAEPAQVRPRRRFRLGAGAMPNRLTNEQLKRLHQGEYVAKHLAEGDVRLRRLLPYFNLEASDVVADFGCGCGRLLDLVHDKVASYYGVDFSEEFIAAARRRAVATGARNAAFECAAIEAFCSRYVGQLDKAFTLDLSEHVYDDTLVTTYGAIRQALKPGGRLYVHTPNGDYLLEVLKRIGVLGQFAEHVAVRNARANLRLLQAAGFTIVALRYLPHYVKPLSHLHFLSYVPALGSLFRARLFIECIKLPGSAGTSRIQHPEDSVRCSSSPLPSGESGVRQYQPDRV